MTVVSARNTPRRILASMMSSSLMISNLSATPAVGFRMNSDTIRVMLLVTVCIDRITCSTLLSQVSQSASSLSSASLVPSSPLSSAFPLSPLSSASLSSAEARRMNPLLHALTNSFSGLRVKSSPARRLDSGFKDVDHVDDFNSEHVSTSAEQLKPQLTPSLGGLSGFWTKKVKLGKQVERSSEGDGRKESNDAGEKNCKRRKAGGKAGTNAGNVAGQLPQVSSGGCSSSSMEQNLGLKWEQSENLDLKSAPSVNERTHEEHQDGHSLEGDEGDEGDDEHQVGEITKEGEMAEHLQRNHEVRNHKARKHGEILYSGESRNADGKEYRYGVVTHASGAFYKGEFVGGKFEGKGKYTAAGGQWLHFVAGESEERAKYAATGEKGEMERRSERWWYEGEWKAGKPHGHGVVLLENGGGMYVGNFVEGRREGHGEYTSADGAKYVGSFYRDEPHGKGRYISTAEAIGTAVPLWARGKAYYEGEWNAGAMHGYGVAVFATGDKYEGNYFAGKFQGTGKLVTTGERRGNLATRRWYEGMFEAGRRNGYGVEEFSTGGKYEGEYVADKFEGQGKFTLTLPEGTAWIAGPWKAGRMPGIRVEVDGHDHWPRWCPFFDAVALLLTEVIRGHEEFALAREKTEGIDWGMTLAPPLVVQEEIPEANTKGDQAMRKARLAETSRKPWLRGTSMTFEEVLATFPVATQAFLDNSATTTVADLVANRLVRENDSVKRKKLNRTLLTLILNMGIDENVEKACAKARLREVSSHDWYSSKYSVTVSSKCIPSSDPSLGTGTLRSVSAREGGERSSNGHATLTSGGKSQSGQDLPAIIAQVLQLEALLQAVDSALEKVMEGFPPISQIKKEQITKLKSSYKRPEDPSDAHDMAMAEIQRIDEELRAQFGNDLDDLLNGRFGKREVQFSSLNE